ncbi:hypothetical protein CTAYLR_009488 [Chrysophaeum taylorii]|uniref:Uncharacterized protein n=1 Tax=Chrysophaeum taylorii TaxID=2483200 RepID=A0AAD7XL05_9STRA|nr:hypothetical protein CTAYLR_009488 [Chrysophaeum taylorii]
MSLVVTNPRAGSCQLGGFVAVAEAVVAVGEEARAAAVLGEAEICFSGSLAAAAAAAAAAADWSCGARGSGEAMVSAPPGAARLMARALVNESVVAESPEIEFEVVGEGPACSRGSHPFPASAASRRAAAALLRRDGVGLVVNWPRPGEVARSRNFALSLSLARSNGSAAAVEGTARIRVWGDRVVSRLVDVRRGGFVEMSVPFAGWAAVKVEAGGLEAPWFEVYFDREAKGGRVIEDANEAEEACLVLCHWTESLEWIPYQPYPAIVYEKRRELRGRASHSTARNTANEASAYLQYIVDYYHKLPAMSVFLHSHRYAYHQEDVLTILNDLQPVDSYCNLNSAAWGTREDPERRLLYRDHRAWVERALGEPIPDLLLDRCCAQFAVHRDRILSRPREFYEEALEVALDPALDEADPEQNRQRGLLFEWLWHHIFGEPPIAPDVAALVPDIAELDIVYLRDRPACLRPATPPSPNIALVDFPGGGVRR